MIASMANAQIKHIQKLMKQPRTRRQEQVFVVEGWKMVGEALVRSLVLYLYVKESEKDTFVSHLQELGCAALSADVPVEIVADSVFRQLSDTVTPQGILAMVQMPHYSR